MNLPGTEKKPCEDLSKGMLQRVQFIAAVIHQPDLLILDEPFSGQDPVSVRLLREHIVREHRRGATVLLSTHVMANAEEMCQHVVMIHQGHKVLDEPVAGLRRQFDRRTIHFEPLDPGADPSRLRGVPGVERVEAMGEGYTVLLVEGTDPAGAIARLAAAVPPARVELARLRLEDVFIKIVSEGARAVMRLAPCAPGCRRPGRKGRSHESSVARRPAGVPRRRDEQGIHHRLAGDASDHRPAGHGDAAPDEHPGRSDYRRGRGDRSHRPGSREPARGPGAGGDCQAPR